MLVYLQNIPDKRDKRKFRKLYDKYSRLMYSVAYNILHNGSDAEDAVHEAFVAISKNFSKISSLDANKMRSCIVIIVRNKAIDIYNANRRRSTLLLDEAYMGAAASDVDISPLAEAMLRLPEKYRSVIMLKYDNGFKSKEIAQMLGMSDGMVRQTLMKARELLRAELEKEGVEV